MFKISDYLFFITSHSPDRPCAGFVIFRGAFGTLLTEYEVVCRMGFRVWPLRKSQGKVHSLPGDKRPQVQQVRLPCVHLARFPLDPSPSLMSFASIS